MNSIDLEASFRTGVDNALTVATWTEAVMGLLRIEGVSQVWSQKPAWYFWIHGAAGPYHLQLESASIRPTPSVRGAQAGLFSLRCYPSQQGDGFSLLSAEEQRLVTSNAFDETGTPRFEHLGDIPLRLFQVAAIEHIKDPDGSWELIIMERLGHARSRVSGQVTRPGKRSIQAEPQFGEPNSLVQAWEVSTLFLDTWVSLFSYSTRHKPFRVAVQVSKGFEDTSDAERTGPPLEGHRIGPTTLVVLGDGSRRAFPDADSLVDHELRLENFVILADERFPSGCFRDVPRRADSLVQMNEHWWTLAEQQFPSVITSICGCKDCDPAAH